MLRLASALAATLLLVTGGVLALGALDDDTVPAVDQAAPDRSLVPRTSRSSDRPTLWSADPSTPDRPTTARRSAEVDPEPGEEAGSSAEQTPEQGNSEPQPQASLAVRTPAVASTESPSLGTSPGPEHSSAPKTTASPTPDVRTPDLPRLDRIAPSTVLDARPRQHDDSATARFGFHADEAASFACSLDGGPFRPCSSGVTFAVQAGWHDFAVRAIDRSGNVDSSPARWHWHTTARG